MYECPTRRRTTRESTVCSSPFPPQFESELIALARRCITLCVRFLSILCFCECPCVLSRLVLPLRIVFVFPATPVMRFYYFPFISTAPALRAPAHPFPSSPCAPQRPVYLRSHGLRQRRAPVCTHTHSYSTFRLRCRCHVTRTRWSRAFAASSWVAQDTHTPPLHIHIHSCRGQLTI